MIGQLALWEPEPCHHGKAPAPGTWTHRPVIDPEEQAARDLYGDELYRPTATIHHPGVCCDRREFH